MSSLRREEGFTLIEMLVVCVISLVIFGATMTAFTAFYGQSRSAQAESDNIDEARLGLEREARQLRNLANPTYNAIATISLASDYDFVFQTSDPAKTWVRYCLDMSNPSAERLYESESATGTLPAAMSAPCGTAVPAPGRTQVVAQHMTNNANGFTRRLFTFRCPSTAPAGCPASSADYPKITTVTTRLWVDADPRDQIKETSVASSVYLRNQNEAPTAVVGPPSVLGAHRVSLNGTGSSDPEGRTLDYFWFEDAPPTAADLSNCTTDPPAAVGTGPLLIEDFPVAQVGTSHTFYLMVRDPGCLTSTSSPVTVTVPS